MDNKFNEEDKRKVVEFLNFIAKEATFTCKTGDIILYFKLLNYIQQTILTKIDANILEIKKVINNIPEIPNE